MKIRTVKGNQNEKSSNEKVFSVFANSSPQVLIRITEYTHQKETTIEYHVTQVCKIVFFFGEVGV